MFNSIIERDVEVICKEKSFNPGVGYYGSWTSIDNKAGTPFLWMIPPWLAIDT
ncbi:hypothetical protein M422DRAFT_255231 [Sphaerobolus stellatus SS14]|uniref:Uncharacterized protein n=1 Tax=Sphaerobolus stellatus (strain SS14) TaxID=990650 RepID=A0A0C9VJ61_SPHS4|nr:hypothetical protein M422DRAFT_255231 [Sphaerobolus stellatus SS14]